MAWTRFNSAILRQGETWLRASASGYTLPNSFLLMLFLANGAINRTSTASQVLATELAQANGYTRQPLMFSTGAYDATQQRGEWSAADVLVTASGQSLQYDMAAIWALPSGQTDPVNGWAEAFSVFSQTQTVFDGTSHTFKATWNVLNTGDVSGA